ncbi:MAG: DUF4440 domain-containing protein [Flavobacteriaceae bacterium]
MINEIITFLKEGLVKLILLIITFFLSLMSNAQVDTKSELFEQLKKNDSLLFESSFNKCKTSDLIPLISEDFEFYHDQGGITNTKKDFVASVKKNICSNPKSKPKRELINGSLQVFALYNKGVLYGAIQKGKHNFFLIEEGKSRATVTAYFTHLWILENKKWLLRRVLSYDHQPIK